MDETTARWWLVRLYRQLMLRNEQTEKYENYFSGDFDTPWLPDEAQADFKRIMRMTRSNYMSLAVTAMVERMKLTGFRREYDDTEGDDGPDGDHRAAGPDLGGDPVADGPRGRDDGSDRRLWRIWTKNQMPSQHDRGLLEAAIRGCFYYSVSPPRPDDPRLPLIYVESPTQCYVEHEAGTNRTVARAAIKAWVDDFTGMVYATVYFPDSTWRFEAKEPSANPREFPTELANTRPLSELMSQWFPREGAELYEENPYGVVPIIESPNDPRLLTGGRSEIEQLWPIQDRVNKTIADRMMTQDYGAFPQKWASGWPAEDEAGTAQDPIVIGRKRIVTTDVAETRFGQFDAAPLDPYSAAKREDVIDIASISRTPPHYLIVGMSSVNGATLKAAESGLVSKVTQRIADHSYAAVAAMELACLMAGIDDAGDIVTTWKNPEYRTQAETTDSLIKMRQAAELPTQIVWELWGATPSEIERWKRLRDAEQRAKMEMALLYDPAAALAEQMRDVNAQGGDAQDDAYTSNDDKRNGDPLPGGGKPADDPQKVVTPNGVTA